MQLTTLANLAETLTQRMVDMRIMSICMRSIISSNSNSKLPRALLLLGLLGTNRRLRRLLVEVRLQMGGITMWVLSGVPLMCVNSV